MAEGLDDVIRNIRKLNLSKKKDKGKGKIKSSKDNLPRQILMNKSLFNLFDNKSIFERKLLGKNTATYRRILAKFEDQSQILNIEQIFNSFSTMAFKLREKSHYRKGRRIELFHGTKRKYVKSICKNNFDWKLSGTERGHKHGYGVNFTPDPMFALNFCDCSGVKVIILADVLVSKITVGQSLLQVPPDGFDTTIRKDKKVYVKFNDAEFNPKFIIHHI